MTAALRAGAWRILAVFISALAVDVSATNVLAAMSDVKWWQDVAGAAIIAGLAELLELARHLGGSEPDQPPVRQRVPDPGAHGDQQHGGEHAA